jgi:hypothetical protein
MSQWVVAAVLAVVQWEQVVELSGRVVVVLWELVRRGVDSP